VAVLRLHFANDSGVVETGSKQCSSSVHSKDNGVNLEDDNECHRYSLPETFLLRFHSSPLAGSNSMAYPPLLGVWINSAMPYLDIPGKFRH
jgi:hypothetical protein